LSKTSEFEKKKRHFFKVWKQYPRVTSLAEREDEADGVRRGEEDKDDSAEIRFSIKIQIDCW
jgi:hypothetical protein